MKYFNEYHFIISILLCSNLYSQQSINGSGGEASGSNGNISYSIGQITVKTSTGSNGSIHQGIQQNSELFVLNSNNYKSISLEASVHPNPVIEDRILYLTKLDNKLIRYRLFTSNGSIIKEGETQLLQTVISFKNYTPGIYILQVEDLNSKKEFTIIKK